MVSGGEGQMGLDDRHSHDVENAAGVGVFGIREFVIAPAPVKSCLDVFVDLPAIGAFEKESILAMSLDSASYCRVSDLLFRHLLDVERFLVSNVELGSNLRDHVM